MMPELSIRTDFARAVREIENTWIPMPDGTRLAARIWLPEDSEVNPVPAILEYLPYRKRDGTVERDHLTHPYFAGHGYAGVRVDMRGTGDSEGVCLGEYLRQEQDDCLAVIEWLAEQPWCSGNVGMIGISWGGFNGLQVAARRPTALGAVISLCSTDDRYADDIHFMGGALLAEKLGWGATAFAIAHTPPDPAIVDERWRDMWIERLDNNSLWLLDWFKHQRRDAFYTHGSICENYEDVKVPVYLVGGWADGYSNTIFRMLENLSCPKKGLVGPWAHKYPHFAMPGPRIGFLQECLRWWDQHLKGVETGIMDEPELRAWIQHPVPPNSQFETRLGHWVTVPTWRDDAVSMRSMFSDNQLSGRKPNEPVTVCAPENTGHTSGNWCGYGQVPDGPINQSEEAGMVSFESEPLDEDVDLLGFPVLTAEVSSDVSQANLVAVLSEVLEDGKATRISYGVLNLTHRNSHSNPEPLPEGSFPVRIKLNACGQRIGKGNRLRLALSNAYWPIIWPSQSKARLKLTNIELDLPLSRGAIAQNCFQEPEGAEPMAVETLASGSYERKRSINYISEHETYEIYNDSGLARHLHTGIEYRETGRETYMIHPDDPNSAVGTCTWTKHYAREEWSADLEAVITVRALQNVWKIEASLKARDADGIVVQKSWSESVDRDLV